MDKLIGRKDSDTVFDFSKDDPLQKTKIDFARLEKGASLVFKNAAGDEQFSVVDKFIRGGLDHFKDAETREDKVKAKAALKETIEYLEKAME